MSVPLVIGLASHAHYASIKRDPYYILHEHCILYLRVSLFVLIQVFLKACDEEDELSGDSASGT